jgi:hypothetical protein
MMSLKYAVGRRPFANSFGLKPKHPRPHRKNRPSWTFTKHFGVASPRLYNCVLLSHPYLGASTLSAFSHERTFNNPLKSLPTRRYHHASEVYGKRSDFY